MAGRDITLQQAASNQLLRLGERAAGARPKLRTAFKSFWWWLRQVSGDAAYENYLQRVGQDRGSGGGICALGSESPVSEEKFYLERLRRQHTGINRCC
jgi:Selenoprotein, putative